MSLAKFLASPWATSHRAYDRSPFNIRPAPETASGEVVLASTYRASGFSELSESEVPRTGRDFDRAAAKRLGKGRTPKDRGITAETWRTVLHGALQSPKRPNQSSRRFLQLTPLVPDVALYSGSARLAGSSWNPGDLVQRIIALGSQSDRAAQLLWAKLHSALSVDQDDDIWARWLNGEFAKRRPKGFEWRLSPLKLDGALPDADRARLHSPARQFTRDLEAILPAKGMMTRRQWISLLESLLRLGTVSHMLWLCQLNERLWHSIRSVLEGGAPPSLDVLSHSVIEGEEPSLIHGAPAKGIVSDLVSRYLSARLGIDHVLWELHEQGHHIGSMSSIADVSGLLSTIASKRSTQASRKLLDSLSELRDREARVISCKRGIGSNMSEFAIYVLAQRQTADKSLRGYDQGFLLRKRGEYKAAPWIVSLGPVALLAVVHCCLSEVSGPRSVQRLQEHLLAYGVAVKADDFAKSDLSRNLRMLGLVLDSPDAEGGMLLVPPFEPPRAESTLATSSPGEGHR